MCFCFFFCVTDRCCITFKENWFFSIFFFPIRSSSFLIDMRFALLFYADAIKMYQIAMHKKTKLNELKNWRRAIFIERIILSGEFIWLLSHLNLMVVMWFHALAWELIADPCVHFISFIRWKTNFFKCCDRVCVVMFY